jgi:hypothetical protein
LSAIAPSDAGAAAVEAQAPAPSSPATAADAAISVGRPLPAAEELPDLEAAPDAAESGGHPETAGVGEPPSPARRLALRLEVDLDRGELLIAIEDGVTARIVRDGDDWRVDGP